MLPGCALDRPTARDVKKVYGPITTLNSPCPLPPTTTVTATPSWQPTTPWTPPRSTPPGRRPKPARARAPVRLDPAECRMDARGTERPGAGVPQPRDRDKTAGEPEARRMLRKPTGRAFRTAAVEAVRTTEKNDRTYHHLPLTLMRP